MFPRLMDYDVFKEISLKPKTQVKPAIFLSFDKKWDSDENILSIRVIWEMCPRSRARRQRW